MFSSFAAKALIDAVTPDLILESSDNSLELNESNKKVFEKIKLYSEKNGFRNKNYYDETTGDCHKAMDKIIELYKENEHGTELVKDIERVLNLQTRDDEYTPSPRTKEYLKQCINLAKGE